MGTMGTPVRRASMAAPVLASPNSPSWWRVPSGNMSSSSPSFRYFIAVLIAATSALPRLTPKMPPCFSTQPMKGQCIISSLAMTWIW